MAESTAQLEPWDSRLVVLKRDPPNAEEPLGEQIGLITPVPLHYVRSNFPIPRLAAGTWRLRIGGEVEHPYELGYDDLKRLPSRSLIVTLECAGNGRSALQPPAEGEQWQYGAVSTAEWTGVPLAVVLERAGLSGRAREIVVEGADRGTVKTRAGEISFARSLARDMALNPDVVLAYAMNGAPLTAEHGFPLRLVVPGWYGMASVKWVSRVEAIDHAFDGYYQTERYIMAHPERDGEMPIPLTTIRLRSLITWPAADGVVPRGMHRVRGLAWSGGAPVARVEVSVDAGASWEPAELVGEPVRYAWRRWEYAWNATAPGRVLLRSRAFDAGGRVQPAAPEWNRLGYANNAVQSIGVTVT